jgi:hypothetical protein
MKTNKIIMNLKALACQHLDLMPRESCKKLMNDYAERVAQLATANQSLIEQKAQNATRISALEASIRAEVAAHFGFSFTLEYTRMADYPWELRFAPSMKVNGEECAPGFYTMVFEELGIEHEGCVAVERFTHRPGELVINERYNRAQKRVDAFLPDIERASSVNRAQNLILAGSK